MAQTNSPISNPVINTFCDLNTTGVVGSPSDVVDARDEEGNMSLLYRKSTDKLVKTLRKAKKLFEKEAPLEHIKILQGPAGAGKSYTLYSLVHFAIQNSWFVFYVADIAKLKRRPEETIAKELVQNFLTMNPEVESDLNLGNGSFIEKFRDLLGALQSRRLKKPLLVAIDQWNALFELAENHFLKTLDYLSQLKLTHGVSIVAVSSSFTPPTSPDMKSYADADYQYYQWSIPLYDDEEFDAIISHKRSRELLPIGLLNSEILRQSGNVPRMIYFMELSWLDVQSKDWDYACRENFNRRATEYYKSRISSVMKKLIQCSEDPQKKNIVARHFGVAAAVFLNKPSTWGDFPDLWKHSGLFKGSEPVCPPVVNAFYQAIPESISNMIAALCTQPGFAGHAFELIFREKLNTGQVSITFKGELLNGTQLTDEKTLYIRDRHHQTTDNLSIESYPEHTLICCYPNHPAIDYVLYTNETIFFVQTSVSSYTSHKTGNLYVAQAIAQKSISRGDSRTILQYYAAKSPYLDHRLKSSRLSVNPRWTDGLKQWCKVIYVTTDETRHNLNSVGGKGVIRVRGEELLQFSESYAHFLR